MDFSSGKLPPISTGRPDNRKLVRTIGGTYTVSVTASGRNAVAPLKPPKNISPAALLKQAPQPVKSAPGSPSAVEERLNVVLCGSNLGPPLLVLIHRAPWSSSTRQPTALPGS